MNKGSHSLNGCFIVVLHQLIQKCHTSSIHFGRVRVLFHGPQTALRTRPPVQSSHKLIFPRHHRQCTQQKVARLGVSHVLGQCLLQACSHTSAGQAGDKLATCGWKAGQSENGPSYLSANPRVLFELTHRPCQCHWKTETEDDIP